MVRSPIGRSKKIFSSVRRIDRRGDPASLLFCGYCGLSRGQSGTGVKLAIHIHLLPTLRMSSLVLPLLSYAFTACERYKFTLNKQFCKSQKSVHGTHGMSNITQFCPFHFSHILQFPSRLFYINIPQVEFKFHIHDSK